MRAKRENTPGREAPDHPPKMTTCTGARYHFPDQLNHSTRTARCLPPWSVHFLIGRVFMAAPPRAEGFTCIIPMKPPSHPWGQVYYYPRPPSRRGHRWGNCQATRSTESLFGSSEPQIISRTSEGMGNGAKNIYLEQIGRADQTPRSNPHLLLQ